ARQPGLRAQLDFGARIGVASPWCNSRTEAARHSLLVLVPDSPQAWQTFPSSALRGTDPASRDVLWWPVWWRATSRAPPPSRLTNRSGNRKSWRAAQRVSRESIAPQMFQVV